ncbi:UNVERIFIED_CONTAM: hypothetical protein BEN50_23220 [Euhalothece sp. KZN 001]|jgi:hypothetical protein
MYTGQTVEPCCLCDDARTVQQIDLPPRCVQLMQHAGSVAWQDVVGPLSLYFCESDWELVCDLVLELGQNPIGRCSVARASMTIREDFETYLSTTREVPDQRPLEAEMRATAQAALADPSPPVDTREQVQARVLLWSLEELSSSASSEWVTDAGDNA